MRLVLDVYSVTTVEPLSLILTRYKSSYLLSSSLRDDLIDDHFKVTATRKSSTIE